MSRYKTGSEKRKRRRARKRAERRERRDAAPGVEIIAQTFRQIGDVAVTFTIGRIHPSKESGNGG